MTMWDIWGTMWDLGQRRASAERTAKYHRRAAPVSHGDNIREIKMHQERRVRNQEALPDDAETHLTDYLDFPPASTVS